MCCGEGVGVEFLGAEVGILGEGQCVFMCAREWEGAEEKKEDGGKETQRCGGVPLGMVA